MGKLFTEILKFIYRGAVELYFQLFVQAKLEFILRKHAPYYHTLKHHKLAFKRRVWHFLVNINFFAREGALANGTMKVIIASHAMQLAHRLPAECYDFYQRIILYNDYYLSNVTGSYHKGEVNPGLRSIVFSLRAIRDSLAKADPDRNILIHEFAHALWLEHQLMHKKYLIFNDEVFERTRSLIATEFGSFNEHQKHLFRDYAFSNEAEFFAIAVENFFLRPALFEVELPAFYGTLSELFKQDPLNWR
jgi:Mlc titration factor MtfA (ptsG expression regulator)